MAYLSVKCPNCSKKIQMDDTSEKGFCMYCGASFGVQDEIQRFQDEDNMGYHASRWKQRQQKYRDQSEPVVFVICVIVSIIALISIIWILVHSSI